MYFLAANAVGPLSSHFSEMSDPQTMQQQSRNRSLSHLAWQFHEIYREAMGILDGRELVGLNMINGVENPKLWYKRWRVGESSQSVGELR